MEFLKVGHCTRAAEGTGVTVFLFTVPAKGTYLVCGSSPATHELATLELDANVTHVDALLFTGGSAFGLSAVSGVMRWCQEQQKGHPTSQGAVPIVPAAGLYDLGVGQPSVPTADDAYAACQAAYENNILQGNIGAGTGASIGKLVPHAERMRGGLGYAELALDKGVMVSAYVAVNALGDVRDASGQIIAGARWPNGEFANCERHLLSGQTPAISPSSNTTLVAVFTNVDFSKIQLRRIAKVAMAGMARAISPVFTRYDGDIIFCFSLGKHHASEEVVSTMAAEAVRQAIVNSVQNSVVI